MSDDTPGPADQPAAAAAMSVEELEGSPDFQALLIAAAGKPERSMGQSVIPAEPPAWSEVRTLANTLRSSAPEHMAIHIHLIKAGAALDGFVGLGNSLTELQSAMRTSWASIYPPPDEDDPDDPYYARVNLLREIAEDPAFREQLYRCDFVSVRGLGAFCTRDIDVAAGVVAGSEEDRQRCQPGLIRGAFDQADLDDLTATHQGLLQAQAACADLETDFAELSGDPNAMSLASLKDIIATCLNRFDEGAQERLANVAEPDHQAVASSEHSNSSESGAEPSAASADAPVVTAPSAGGVASLADRAGVVATLDQITAYYQAFEPGSPVPLLVHRARQMADKSFFEVLHDLVPGQTDLSVLVEALSGNPLGLLMTDCHRRFLSGEPVTGSTESGEAGMPGDSDGVDTAAEPITSREQVMAALQEVDRYYTTREPASPIPLITREIRKLLPKTFTELLAEFDRALAQPVVATTAAPVEAAPVEDDSASSDDGW